MQIDGYCYCGRITFTAQVDPARVMVCHCTDCQYLKVAESGNRRLQVFCPECGTPLFATAPENATQVIIRTGCVKQRAALTPNAQIWRRSALPWVAGVADLPGSAEQQAFIAPRR